MQNLIFGFMAAAGLFTGTCALAQAPSTKPTIVLVHGAFADASSWNGVVNILHKEGHFVIAAANPLRGVKNDGSDISSLVADLKMHLEGVETHRRSSTIDDAAQMATAR